ncbi:MAG: RNA-binding cell elongation regulator Jag/EloR [Dehalococcoidia bacterium]
MRVIETTGKTIEEAIDIALVELNASREEVEIKVITRGKSGLLGFGNEEARVKVEKKSDVPENIENAYEILRNILELVDSKMTITTKLITNDKISDSIISLDGDDAALIIGRRGETLRSLQYLVNLMIQKKLGKRDQLVSLDVEGYIEKKLNNLFHLSKKMESRVLKTKKKVALEPMSSFDRRYVHRYFSDHKSIISESEDFGRDRHVVLKLK